MGLGPGSCARAGSCSMDLINRSKRNVELTTQTVLEAVLALAERGLLWWQSIALIDTAFC